MTLTRGAVPSKVEEPEHVFRQAHGANYTPASRTAEDVYCVVLHQTESGGDPFGDANWFANPAAHTSAQCIVGRDGTLVKCMRYRDIAWHAGNWEINQKSVGVEIDGFSAHSDTPEAQYRKVAQGRKGGGELTGTTIEKVRRMVQRRARGYVPRALRFVQ
jgi:N-acetyl-anhydromuramyl-L-alanine amidase AmpD